MTVQNTCRECGATLPTGSPAGFCPKCLLGLALGGAAFTNKDSNAVAPVSDEPAPGHIQGDEGAVGSQDAAIETVSDQIPGYRLLQEIGHGGCGVVYMAEQERPVKRKVALKVIKIGMDTREVVTRFDAERQVLARMDHPNIAKVLDAGATSKGRPYFAMELVGGLKITEFCDQNRLTTSERLELFVQVCRAIQHAHQKGIIHRDIKPSNVLVAQHDGIAIPKVIDFGIAKATQGRLSDQTLFTAFEQFLGTPVYMSPEQAEPGGLDVDTRSDIYSLGVLLYELLTGKTPFNLKSASGAELETVRRTVLEREPIKPSTRLNSLRHEQLTRVAQARQIDPLRLVRLIRGDLDWIMMKCLEKDRARRYETANGLAMDIQRYLDREPVLARPPSPAYRIRKFVSRNRLATLSAGAISLSLILGTGLSTWLAVKATRAEHEQRRLRQEAQTARQQGSEELWASCLAQARAQRMSRQAGASFDGLSAIAKAAAIRPSLELRNEAIASLAQADIRWVSGQRFGKRTVAVTDPSATYYALFDGIGTVTVCRISDNLQMAVLPGVSARTRGIWVFSGNNLLAVAYVDNRTRIWDWQRRSCVCEMPSPQAIDISPDGTRVAVCVAGRISILELSGRNQLLSTTDQSADAGPEAWGLRFAPTGTLLAAYNENHTNILIIEVPSGKIVQSLIHEDGVYRLAWTRDGKHIADSCLDGFIHTWDVQTGKEVKRLPGYQGIGVLFNPEGTILASSGWDGRTRLWEFPNGRQLVNIYKSGEAASFSANGRTLVEIPWDGHGLDLFEVTSSRGLRTLNTHESDRRGPAGSVVFSRDGSLLAFQSAEGVRLWDTRTHQEVGLCGNDETGLVGFDSTDRTLILVDEQGLLSIPLQVPSASPITGEVAPSERHVGLGRPGRQVANVVGRSGRLSQDGNYCFLVGSNRCQIFNTHTFSNCVTTGIHLGMRFFDSNPDGSLVATGAWLSPGVVVWDARTGEQVKSFASPETTSVVFSPDGQYLVTATAERYLFWQVGSWAQVLSIPQQTNNDFVAMMAFSPDGRIFAGTHSRNIVRLHDAATGEVLADLEPPDPHTVTHLAFNDDGSCLAVCEGYEATRIWDLQAIRSHLAPLGLDWKLSTTASRQPAR